VLDAAYRSLKTGTWDTVTPSDAQVGLASVVRP